MLFSVSFAVRPTEMPFPAISWKTLPTILLFLTPEIKSKAEAPVLAKVQRSNVMFSAFLTKTPASGLMVNSESPDDALGMYTCAACISTFPKLSGRSQLLCIKVKPSNERFLTRWFKSKPSTFRILVKTGAITSAFAISSPGAAL